MVTFRCTRKLLKFLGINPVEVPNPPTGKLGNWYANLVPTLGGDLIVFVNERSLVTVAIPSWGANDIEEFFRARVINLFRMLDISEDNISQEIKHYHEIQYAKTESRSLLGSMNDIAWNYQFIAEERIPEGTLSLSDAEFELSNMPSIAQNLFPSDKARTLVEN